MFEFNSVKYDFKLISVKDAIEVQDIIIETSKNDIDLERSKHLEGRLREIAMNYLRVYLRDGGVDKTIEAKDMDEDYFAEQVFMNPFYQNEIVASFGRVISGFLESLPTFKKRLEEAEKEKNKKSKNTSKS